MEHCKDVVDNLFYDKWKSSKPRKSFSTKTGKDQVADIVEDHILRRRNERED